MYKVFNDHPDTPDIYYIRPENQNEYYSENQLLGMAALEQQRDELLAALKELADTHDKGYPISGEFIRVAIAKVDKK